VNETRKESFHHQAEQNIELAALQMARRVQTPGQTKEQTRLIAQGIAKGIALYKRQQSEKAREREKARKKLLKQRMITAGAEHEAPCAARTDRPFSLRAVTWSAGVWLGAVAIILLGSVVAGVTVGTWTVPAGWLLVIGAVSGALAVWLFLVGLRGGSGDPDRVPRRP